MLVQHTQPSQLLLQHYIHRTKNIYWISSLQWVDEFKSEFQYKVTKDPNNLFGLFSNLTVIQQSKSIIRQLTFKFEVGCYRLLFQASYGILCNFPHIPLVCTKFIFTHEGS